MEVGRWYQTFREGRRVVGRCASLGSQGKIWGFYVDLALPMDVVLFVTWIDAVGWREMEEAEA